MKNLKYIIGILTITLALVSFTVLEFYSSMTKADYIDGSQKIEFTTKLNTKHISEVLNINQSTTGFEAAVKKYVNDHFKVTVDGTNKELTFTGSQVSGETVFIDFEAHNIPSIGTLTIKNDIMLQNYNKQINIVNIQYKGKQKTMNFRNGNDVQSVSF